MLKLLNKFILPYLNDNVSAWMSANLLSLNQSKTEFLLIGLSQQLSIYLEQK